MGSMELTVGLISGLAQGDEVLAKSLIPMKRPEVRLSRMGIKMAS